MRLSGFPQTLDEIRLYDAAERQPFDFVDTRPIGRAFDSNLNPVQRAAACRIGLQLYQPRLTSLAEAA